MNIWFLIKAGDLCDIYRKGKHCTECARILTFVFFNISWVLWDTWERSVSGKPSVVFVWLTNLHLLIPTRAAGHVFACPGRDHSSLLYLEVDMTVSGWLNQTAQ